MVKPSSFRHVLAALRRCACGIFTGMIRSDIFLTAQWLSLKGGAPVRERQVGEHNSNFTMVFIGDISIVFMGL